MELNYDNNSKIGIARSNVVLRDTAEDITIKGEYLYYNDSTEYMRSEIVDSLRPLLIHELEEDTLYLSSDTLEFYNEIIEQDTFKHFKGTNHTKILLGEISGLCGNLIYSDIDSSFTLMDNPIMWNDSMQFFGDTIVIYLKNKKIDRMRLQDRCMMINELQGDYYNQIAGRQFISRFDSSELKSTYVSGNSRALYYMQDSLNAFIAQNLTDCSRMHFFFENDELADIKFYEDPASVLTPMSMLRSDALFLESFSWQIERRPKNVEDLLRIDNLAVSLNEGREERIESEIVKPEAPSLKSKNAGQN